MDLCNNKCLFTNNKGDFGYKSSHKQQIMCFPIFFYSIMSPIEPHWAPLSPIDPIEPHQAVVIPV